VFRWLNVQRRRKRDIEASASHEHISQPTGNLIKPQWPLRREHQAIGLRNIESSVMSGVDKESAARNRELRAEQCY